MMQAEKRLVQVELEDGPLSVAHWPGDGPNLLLVHGISASHMAWAEVVAHLPAGFNVYAPDLRGRGASNSLPGPFGLGRHVDDLSQLIDQLIGAPVAFAGHSLGAYIGVQFGATRPDKLTRIVLVDGGIALPLPAGLVPEQLLEKTLGPALARLELEFSDRAAYRAFWREHPAFNRTEAWNSFVEAYFDYDLIGEEPHLRSRVAEAAVRTDGLDPMRPEMVTMIDQVKLPMLLLTAERGLLDQPEPLMRRSAVQAKVTAIDHLDWRELEGTNHYSITLGNGAARTAAAIASFAQT